MCVRLGPGKDLVPTPRRVVTAIGTAHSELGIVRPIESQTERAQLQSIMQDDAFGIRPKEVQGEHTYKLREQVA